MRAFSIEGADSVAYAARRRVKRSSPSTARHSRVSTSRARGGATLTTEQVREVVQALLRFGLRSAQTLGKQRRAVSRLVGRCLPAALGLLAVQNGTQPFEPVVLDVPLLRAWRPSALACDRQAGRPAGWQSGKPTDSRTSADVLSGDCSVR
jgi:hypothetical protein